MAQFKETEIFENLQTKVYEDIVGVILSYMKEAGMSEDKLKEVSDSIYYDIFAIMGELGKQQIPGAEIYADKMKSTLKEMAALEEKLKEMTVLEEKLKEITVLEEKVKEMDALKEKLSAMEADQAKAQETARSEVDIKEEMELHDLKFDNFDSIVEEEDVIEEEENDMDDTTTDAVLDMDQAQKILKSIKSS